MRFIDHSSFRAISSCSFYWQLQVNRVMMGNEINLSQCDVFAKKRCQVTTLQLRNRGSLKICLFIIFLLQLWWCAFVILDPAQGIINLNVKCDLITGWKILKIIVRISFTCKLWDVSNWNYSLNWSCIRKFIRPPLSKKLKIDYGCCVRWAFFVTNILILGFSGDSA